MAAGTGDGNVRDWPPATARPTGAQRGGEQGGRRPQPSPSPLLLPLRPLLRRRFGTCPQGPRAIAPGGTVRPDGQRRTHTWGRPRTHLGEGARLRAPRGSPTAPAQRYGVPAAGGGPAGVGAPSLCRGGGELPARFSAIPTPEFQQVQEKLEVPKARPGNTHVPVRAPLTSLSPATASLARPGPGPRSAAVGPPARARLLLEADVVGVRPPRGNGSCPDVSRPLGTRILGTRLRESEPSRGYFRARERERGSFVCARFIC